MRLRSRVGIAAGVLFLGAVVFLWPSKSAKRTEVAQSATAAAPSASRLSQPSAAAVSSNPGSQLLAAMAARHVPAKSYRLSNSKRPQSELDRDNRTISLRNAIIDTGSKDQLQIPEALKAGKNPGSYVVQTRNGLSQSFYNALRQAGAEFVSYIPNNAVLVAASESAAAQLQANWTVQAILPYEPYYKLDSSLLPVALGDRELTVTNFAVTAFPNHQAELRDRLQTLGVDILGEDRTPFGTSFFVSNSQQSGKTGRDLLLAMAQYPQVQEIEPSVRRVVLNDLTRPKLGVAVDSLVDPNYQNLTGSNVIVAINDSGVDAQHPGLTGRVFADPNAPAWLLSDSNTVYGTGHGTHVAGIIAGNGAESVTVSNAPGSPTLTNGQYAATQFRGMAPQARLFVQPVDLVTGPLISDSYLQVSASQTNATICNNSWGYAGQYSYNMSAASYDAATRDAEPDKTNSQPLLFVFAAGNDGLGGDDGTGAQSGSILSPATAKNVITVGALEAPRYITNEVHYVNGTNIITNTVWKTSTDSDVEVASFSSRGNVGIGEEGQFGRFKPDVVAPGVFVVSTRASTWQDPVASARVDTLMFPNQSVESKATNINMVTVPSSGVLMLVQVYPNASSPAPFPPNLVIMADTNPAPSTVRSGDFTVAPGNWYVAVYNPNSQPVGYDMGVYILETNAYGDRFEVLKGINDQLKPYYRFESGTSMAAPAVSGVLALMQQFYNEQLKIHPSPALMKALLINGAYPTANYYDYQVNKLGANDEGWGLVNLTTSIPGTNNVGTNSGGLLFYDQSVNGALATGESCTREINIVNEATNAPLRVTLVWTDPPGNPVAGIKLVNDLDLIVSNKITGQVYLGNNFAPQTVYTSGATNSTDTNVLGGTFTNDIVNNVENVYIEGTEDSPLSTDYAITVKAKRVNVNAVPEHPNGIVQDYALVISSGSVTSSAPISIVSTTTQVDLTPWVVGVSNGVPVLYQRVGANPSMLADTNGVPIQWRYYTFTNATGSNTPYVAIMTFMPPNLSTPRNFDADIDLYVSTNSALTNLDANAIASADKSLNRGGVETILYTNSAQGTIYYIGVKAEDQKAAEFGLLAVASDKPFSDTDANGNIVARAVSLPVTLADGSPWLPRRSLLFAFSTDKMDRKIRRISVNERLDHQYAGDIYALLNRGSSVVGNEVWLNNHSALGTNTVSFDDSGETRGSIHSDGPGSLRSFVGDRINGAWMTTIWDNAAADAGVVTDFSMVIAPRPYDPYDFYVTLRPDGWYYDYLDLPTDVTNLNISVGFVAGDGPVDILLRKGDFPPPADHSATNIMAPGGALNVSVTNTPPISRGRWFYGLHNGSSKDVTLHVVITVSRAMIPDLIQTYYSSNTPSAILDDARNQSSIYVPESKTVLATSVGVRLNDARASDLALTLTSPQGTRVVLFENRGTTNTAGIGLGVTNSLGTTNVVYTMFTENTNWASQLIKFAPAPYASTNDILTTNYTIFSSGFETNRAWNYTLSTNNIDTNNPVTNVFGLPMRTGIYTNGEIVDGWLVESNLVITNLVVDYSGATNITNLVVTNIAITNFVSIVADVTNSVYGTGTNAVLTNSIYGTNYLALGNGRLLRTATTIPGKPYRFSYIYRNPGLTNWWPADAKANDLVGMANGLTNGLVTYTNGEVGNAWTFNGKGYVDLGTNVGNFGTNDFTIEFWLSATNLGKSQSVLSASNYWSVNITNDTVDLELSDGTTQFAYAGLTNVDDGAWHHIAFTRKETNLLAYIDGVLNVYTNTASIINLSNTSSVYVGRGLQGAVDELDFFTRALSPLEIQAIYDAGSLGKYSSFSPQANAQLIMNGVTNYIVANSTEWLTNRIAFIATNDTLQIELVGSPISPLLDLITLEELANTNYDNFYYGEESLDAFKEENAQGFWTLSLWDTRAGTLSTNNSLLSWELQLTFSGMDLAVVTLTNRVPYTNTIGSNSFQFFAIDVPINAKFATNTMESLNPGDPLDLIYNSSGLPTGNLPGDAYLITQQTNGVAVLNTTVLPFLVPGQRYFLAINNLNSTPEDYRVEVDFDVTTNIDAYTLTNSEVILTNTWGLNAVGTATNGYQYFAFDISSNATMAKFEVFDMTNDIDVILGKGLPLPTRDSFDYISANPGTNVEAIQIATNSSPVPLAPGPWYMGVYGYSTNGTTYKVRVTEWISTLTGLTNGMPYTNFVASNYSRFFYVDVPRNATAATNYLITTNSQLNLYFSQTGLPTTNSTLLFGTNTSGTFVLRTNTIPPLVPGKRYYLWVTQTNDQPAQTFTIGVDFELQPPVMTPLANGVALTNTVTTGECDYYSFNVSGNSPMRLQFDLFGLSGDVNLMLRRSLPVPDQYNFDYRSDNVGVAPEQIIVTNSSSFTIPPGTWYLAVTNVDLTDVAYTIRATEWDWDPATAVVLTNGMAYSNTVAPNSIAYFAVDAPPRADAATNALTSISSEPLTLLFNQVGSPTGNLPGDYALLSTTTTAPTNAILSADPWPVSTPALVPGQRYYLAVSNGNPANVQFAIKVDFELSVILLTNGVGYNNSVVSNGPVQYYEFDASSNAAVLAFEVPNMSADVNLVVRRGKPLPMPMSFDYRSDNSDTNAELILVTTNSYIPAKPGPWYLGVYSPTGGAANYTVRATEWGGAGNPATVINGVAAIDTIPAHSFRYYSIFVPVTALTVHNQLICSNSPLDLLFNQAAPPTGYQPGDLVLSTGVISNTVDMTTNSVPPIVKGTNYFLTVRNTTATSQPFSLRVSMDEFLLLTNAIAYTNSIGASGMQYYGFEVANTATEAAFEILQTSGNVDMVLKQGMPFPTSTNYQAMSANPSTNAESIVLQASENIPTQLTPGWWYLSVYSAEGTNQTAPITYTIRAMQETAPGGATIVTLTNGQPYASAALPGVSFYTNNEFIYYKFTVDQDQPRLVFTITNATGVPGMLVRWNYLPTPQVFDFAVSNTTAGSSSLTIMTDPIMWPALFGDWYVAVPNWGATNMNFNIEADLLSTRATRIVDLTNAVSYSAIAGPNGLVDENGDPVLYRFTVNSNDSAVIFNIANAQGEVDLYAKQNTFAALDTFDFASTNVAPMPDGLLIVTNSGLPSLNGQWYLGVNNPTDAAVPFDIMATLLTPPSAFVPAISVTSVTNGFSCSWASYPGMEYEVDYTADLNVPFAPVTNIIATGTSLNFLDSNTVTNMPQGFYRLRLLGMPGSGQLPPTLP